MKEEKKEGNSKKIKGQVPDKPTPAPTAPHKKFDIFQEMKKECKKHFSNNDYDCPSCKFENVCSVIQFNSYPRFWSTSKMEIK